MKKVNSVAIYEIEEFSPNVEAEKGPKTNRNKKMRKVPQERTPYTFNGIPTY